MPSPSSIDLQQAKTLLNEVVVHAFESLFFTEIDQLPSVEGSKLENVEGLEVTVDIKSEFSGKVSMYLSLESARRLVGLNLSSTFTELTNDVIADTFAELLNTIGGRFAAGIQTTSSFDLSIPQVQFARILEQKNADLKSCYRVEHGLVCFTLSTCHEPSQEAVYAS